MYSGRNTTWLSNRATTNAVPAQVVPGLSREATEELVLWPIRWLSVLPAWGILAMILFATSAICSAVIIRSRGELQTSSFQYNRLTTQIESLRRSNSTVHMEIRKLTEDSATIESAARERLGMVKPNDIVVPNESVGSSFSLQSIDFVR